MTFIESQSSHPLFMLLKRVMTATTLVLGLISVVVAVDFSWNLYIWLKRALAWIEAGEGLYRGDKHTHVNHRADDDKAVDINGILRDHYYGKIVGREKDRRVPAWIAWVCPWCLGRIGAIYLDSYSRWCPRGLDSPVGVLWQVTSKRNETWHRNRTLVKRMLWWTWRRQRTIWIAVPGDAWAHKLPSATAASLFASEFAPFLCHSFPHPNVLQQWLLEYIYLTIMRYIRSPSPNQEEPCDLLLDPRPLPVQHYPQT